LTANKHNSYRLLFEMPVAYDLQWTATSSKMVGVSEVQSWFIFAWMS